MLVAQILRQKGSRIVSVKPEDRVSDVAQFLARERIGAVLVRDGAGDVLGIISERDIVRGLARHGEATLKMLARELMTADVTFCHPEDSIDHVMNAMTNGRFRHIPVKRGAELVGLVSIGDIVKARIEEAEMEAEAMREYIATG